jgi:hypothetical protein
MILSYLEDEIYLFVLGVVMVVSGIIKEKRLLDNTYGYLKSKFKSNRAVISILSLISGVLPIQGRASISAGILDTATSDDNCIGCESRNNSSRKKLGVVDYLTTHHFYMWSPLEKTVILPMGAFGLSYLTWLGTIWPLIAVSALFIISYCWFAVKEGEVEIKAKLVLSFGDFVQNALPFLLAIIGYIALGGKGPLAVFGVFGVLLGYYIIVNKAFDLKKLNSYINWKTLGIIAVIFAVAGYAQEHRSWIEPAVRNVGLTMHTVSGFILISLIAFSASFSMGSSGKFAAVTVLLSTVFGKEYLPWFFALDYTGYLLTPVHDCVMIGKRYFGTSLKTYYTALITWAILLLSVAGVLITCK